MGACAPHGPNVEPPLCSARRGYDVPVRLGCQTRGLVCGRRAGACSCPGAAALARGILGSAKSLVDDHDVDCGDGAVPVSPGL